METWARKTRGIHRLGTRANQPLATDVLEGTLYFVSDEGIIERSNGATWDIFGSVNGDVVGPSSSVDNAVSRFDGITGKIIQNSGVTIDDNGKIESENNVLDDGVFGNVGIGTKSFNRTGASGGFRVITLIGSQGSIFEFGIDVNTAAAGNNLGIFWFLNGSTICAAIKGQNSGTDSGNIVFSTAPAGGGIVDRWRININGHFHAIADNTYDIGASGSTRPRNIFAANNISTINSIGVGTASPTARLHLPAGTATANSGPLKHNSGTLLTTPEVGVREYDGIGLYNTIHATNGRALERNMHVFRLTVNGAAIGPGIADYFGANSAFPTVASSVYKFTFHLYYSKTTAGTVTYTLTNTQTYTNLVANYIQTIFSGMETNQNRTGAGIVGATAAVSALPITQSLTTAVNHHCIIEALAEVNLAGNIRLRVTSSAGTITPLRGSYYTVERIPVANTGIFVA